MPPTASSLSSVPSTVTLPPRPNCPAEEIETVLVLVGSKLGAGELPGISSASSRKLRPFNGRFPICWAFTTPSTTEETVLTADALLVSSISMVVCCFSIGRRNLTLACCPTSSATRAIAGAKPFAWARISYSPGARLVKTNRPTLVVSVVRSSPVALLTALICALETTAPWGSVTSPLSAAVPDSWAKAVRVNNKRLKKTSKGLPMVRTLRGSWIKSRELCLEFYPTRAGNHTFLFTLAGAGLNEPLLPHLCTNRKGVSALQARFRG